VLACALVLVTASRAHAHFEGAVLSARTASLGGAFVALADDPSAVVDNPAGLSGLAQPALLTTYQKPYGVDGLDEGFVAVSIPTRWVTMGAAFFHRGLDDALSENRVTFALARDLKRTAEDASLSIGASVDVATVSAAGEIDESDATVSLGAGVLLRPFAFIGVGYTIRNITAPDIHLVEGGPGTTLARAQAIGLSYYWQERLIVTVETYEDASSSWRSRGGMELRLGPNVRLRGGLDDEHVAAGLGIVWQSVGFDAALRSHDGLGESYIVSLRYARRAPETTYGTP
jgi:hypothetical protein